MEIVGAAISTEEKARYEAARKELAQALTKKRAVDRQLVRIASLFLSLTNANLCQPHPSSPSGHS